MEDRIHHGTVFVDDFEAGILVPVVVSTQNDDDDDEFGGGDDDAQRLCTIYEMGKQSSGPKMSISINNCGRSMVVAVATMSLLLFEVVATAAS